MLPTSQPWVSHTAASDWTAERTPVSFADVVEQRP